MSGSRVPAQSRDTGKGSRNLGAKEHHSRASWTNLASMGTQEQAAYGGGVGAGTRQSCRQGLGPLQMGEHQLLGSAHVGDI